MVKETQAETEERLKEERAIEIIDRLRDGYKRLFKEDISDDEIVNQLNLKIEQAKASFIQHMLHNLCGTVLEPEDLYRAKKMIAARTLVVVPEPVIPVVVPEPIKPQQEEAIAKQRGRPRAK